MFGKNLSCLALLAMGAVCSGLAGCAESDKAAVAAGGGAKPVDVTKPEVAAEPAQPLRVEEQVASAKASLSNRIGIDAGKIELETVRNVHWSSGALGCPKPGMGYTMALVPGVQILLRVNGQLYRYHAGRSGPPSFCPADRAESPVLGQGEQLM